MSLQKRLAVQTNSPHRIRVIFTIVAVALMGSLQLASCAAPLTIAANGKSTFSIVVPTVAAHSVNKAAIELQRDIEEATGAKLPIVKDDAPISEAFISLGSTKQAQAANVTLQGVKEEGYRIVTKAGNLYIIGIDTTAVDLNWPPGKVGDNEFKVVLHPEIPGPALTENGGFSYGTANGVYSFLEDYLGVRWLMPGDIGRDVPRKSTFTINDINLTHAPMFNYRLMPYVWDRNFPAWQDHMKLGYSFRLNHNHAWADVVPASMYKDHPEWFAMDGSGKRPAPQNKNYKLETTNPELIKFYADKAIEAFKAHPKLNTFSLTPTDGIGYSQSPESKALYDKEHGTNIGPSVTPLILKFYQDVSAAVAKEYPQGKLAGIFYQLYLHPPSDGSAKIPENFIPVLVSVGSYNNFYKPTSRETDATVLREWGNIAPENWYYYVAPTWLRNSESMVTPAMPENINFIFREMVKNGIKGVYYYGNRHWSQVALANYIAAKMLWDPQADAVALQREWLHRAYGPQAGAVMEEFYNRMDESWFSDYYRQADSTGNATSEAFFSRIYGKHYRQMEELILKAEAQPMTDIQKERLRLISDNMRMLQWRLRSAGYLPEGYSSPYTINTEQVFALKSNNDDSRGIIKAGGAPTNGTPVTPVKIEFGQPKQEGATKIPNPAHILLYPTKSGKVQLKPTNVNSGSSFLYYFVQDENGKLITGGLLDNKAEIAFEAKANSPYYFQTAITGVSLNPQDKWEVAVPGAVPAQAGFEDGVLYLKAPAENQDRSLYVYVPEGLNRVAVSNETGALIQAQSSERQKSQEMRYAGIAARTALATALEKYQGSLVQNLDSGWKLNADPEKKGVEEEFFKADFDDKAWKTARVIGPWHDNGLPEYYGTAWYRKNFTITMADFDTAQLQNKKLLLFVGAVDGDAVFYLNGEKIAERNQRDFIDSWQVPFALDVTSKLQVGRNTLAVQVTKDRRAAGLYKGVSLIAGVLEDK